MENRKRKNSGGVTVAEGEQRYLAVDVDGAARTVTFVL